MTYARIGRRRGAGLPWPVKKHARPGTRVGAKPLSARWIGLTFNRRADTKVPPTRRASGDLVPAHARRVISRIRRGSGRSRGARVENVDDPLLLFVTGGVCRLGDRAEQLTRGGPQVQLAGLDTVSHFLPKAGLDLLGGGAPSSVSSKAFCRGPFRWR